LKIDSELIAQVKRYIFVGLASALIELVFFVLLNTGFAMDVRFANPIAITCSTAVNFTLNRNYSFKSTAKPYRSALLYILLFLFNQVFSTSLIYMLALQGVLPVIAKTISMACIVAWNFVLYRKVIFT